MMTDNENKNDKIENKNSDEYFDNDIYYQKNTNTKPEESYFQTEEDQNLNQSQLNATPDIQEKISAVARSKGASQVIMGIAILAAGALIYYSFQPSQEEKLAASEANRTEVAKNVENVKPPQPIDDKLFEPQVPALPAAPTLVAPAAPPEIKKPEPPVIEVVKEPVVVAPPVIPTAPVNNVPSISSDQLPIASVPDLGLVGAMTSEERKARLKSGMVILGGSAESKSPIVDAGGEHIEEIKLNSNRVVATKIGNLSAVIAQGKVIDAVLETAINTDLPGMARGIVIKDVYSEAGSNVLIPRGSRLIGEYKSDVALGQQRVEVNWARLIRPDGIDIALNSLTTDAVGRAGLQGHVDNKYMEMFANTALLSIINIGVGRWEDILDKRYGTTSTQFEYKPQQCTYTTPQGVITRTCDPDPVTKQIPMEKVPLGAQNPTTKEQDAYKKAGQDISDLGKDIISKQIQALKPTISISQGTRIRVFVKTDLVFPSNLRVIR